MHELAVYLHLDEATVDKLVAAGKIPVAPGRSAVAVQARGDRSSGSSEQLVGDDESFVDVPDGMKLPLEDLLPDQAIITNLRANTPDRRDRGARGARVHERLARRQAVVRRRGRRARVAGVDGDGGRRRVPAHAREGQGQDRAAVHRRRAVVGGHPVRRARRQPDVSCSSCSASSTTGCTCRSSAGSRARCATRPRSRSCARCRRPIRCARCCSRRTRRSAPGSCPEFQRGRRSSPSSTARCACARSAASRPRRSAEPETAEPPKPAQVQVARRRRKATRS